MDTNIRSSRGFLLAALLCGMLYTTSSFAATTAGTVIFAVGDSWIQISGSNQKRIVRHGEQVSSEDTLITGENGHIHLRMIDRAFIALRPESQLKLEEYRFDESNPEQDRARLLLKNGTVRTVSGKLAQRSKNRYRLNTPVAAIGVRGTDYTVITTAALSEVDVLQGGIAMSPFNASCKASSLGPCQGASSVDLYASMKQHYLRLRSGDDTPDLMEGRLTDLSRPEDARSLSNIRTSSAKTSGTTTEASQSASSDTSEHREATSETTDRDGDGVADLFDAFPEDPNEVTDTDGDGIGNNQDLDDDNDGIADTIELAQGSNPLSNDTDGDGVRDDADSNPTRADGIIVEIGGKRTAVPESLFNSLQISEVSLQQIKNPNTTGTVYRQYLQLSDEQNSLRLTRSHSQDGRVFWGAAGSGQAWDTKVSKAIEDTGYQSWSIEHGNNLYLLRNGHKGQDVSSQADRWDAYYKRGNYTPLVSSDALYLNSVNGLESAFTPDINKVIPDLGLAYNLNASEIQIFDQDGLPRMATVTDFDFTMHYPNQSFEAILTISVPGGDDIYASFNGTVNESGMVFGGSDEAYLKGFFVNQMEQIALIFSAEDQGQMYNGTLLLARGDAVVLEEPIKPTFKRFQSNTQADVKWGRWTNFAEIQSDHEIEKVLQNDRLIAHNRVFALMRPDTDMVLPSEGVINFAMADNEAIYKQGNLVETASISSPSLTVDFNERTFETQLTVTSPTLSSGVDVNARGALGVDGVFASDAQLSNSQVTGALINNGNGAGMIFERDLEKGFVSGAVEWVH